MKAFLNSKKLSLSLFFIYLFILTWVIVAKMDWSLLKSSNLSWLHNPKLLLHPGVTWRSINLVPFRNGNFDPMEVLLNIVFFIPFSIYIKVLNPKRSGISAIFLGFLLSFIYESTQYVFKIGFPDITDLITNTLGAIIGVLFINFLSLLLKNNLRIFTNFLLIIFTFYILYEIYYVIL